MRLIIIIVLLFFICLLLRDIRDAETKDDFPTPAPIEQSDSIPYNPDSIVGHGAQNLFMALQYERVQLPELFTRVAIQETGWAIRPVFKNNFFGFKCNAKSPFVCSCADGYSEFETPKHTFAFLREWIAYDRPKGDMDAYNWLRWRGYNPNPEYYEKIKKHDFWK